MMSAAGIHSFIAISALNDFKEVYLLAFEHAQQRLFAVPAERFMSTRVFSVIRSF